MFVGYIMASVGSKRPQESSRDLKRPYWGLDKDLIQMERESWLVVRLRYQMASTDHRKGVNADITQVHRYKDTTGL